VIPTNKLLRRIHLYLGLILLPWFLLYGISSGVFNHAKTFKEWSADGRPDWIPRFERDYAFEIPTDDDAKRQAAARALTDLGLGTDQSFGTWQPNEHELVIYTHTFWQATNVRLDTKANRVLVEDQRSTWDGFMIGAHARGGFKQELVLVDLWAAIIDLICLGMLLWVITGVYMWWRLPSTRRWGAVALGSGLITFAVLILGG
jgi:hypothetical protein